MGPLSDLDVRLKYYLFQALGNPGFIAPVYVLYVHGQGVSYTAIGAIGTIQSLVVLGGEVPSGYVGDRVGRRNSLLLAQVLFGVSAVGMVVAEGFVGFALAFGLLSFAGTFVSGSADAWLYDVLTERLDGDSFTAVRGRGSAVRQWAMAATMISGGVLYVIDPVYPFVAMLLTRVATLAVVLTMPPNAQYADDGDASGEELTIVDALPIIRERLNAPALRPFVAYMALFFGVAMTVGIYVQPIAVDTLKATAGERLAALGIPEAASLGLLYATFSVVAALASDRASDLEDALGVGTVLLVLPMATAVLFVLPAVFPVLVFPMFLAFRGTQSLVRPIAGQYINDHVASVGRATLLSAVSMVYALARVPLAVGSGVVADAYSPILAVAALGAGFLAVGGALYAWRPPTANRENADGPVGTPGSGTD